MRLNYYIQKVFGRILDTPIIKEGRTVGYSLVRSERCSVRAGNHTRIAAPYYLRNVVLGEYSYISRNCNATNVVIGKFCSIGPNFSCGLGIHPTNGLSTSPMFYSTAKQNGLTLCKEDKVEEFKQSRIGNDVFIGANVTILDGISIGDGAVIGAGAVVVEDIPPYAIAVGIPARVKRYRFSDDIISKLLELKWWDREEELRDIEEYFFDIDGYLEKQSR